MKIFSLLLIIALFMGPITANKANALPFTNFGGVIVGILPCPLSANWILFISDKRVVAPIPLVFQPGLSFLYKMYQPRPAVNAVGSFIPGGVCNGFPVVGTILQLGTSLSIGI